MLATPPSPKTSTVRNGRFSFRLWLGALVCGVVMLAACNGDDNTSASDPLPAEVLAPLASTPPGSADLSTTPLPANDSQGEAITPQPSAVLAPAPPTLVPGTDANISTATAPSLAVTPSSATPPSTTLSSTATTAPQATTIPPATTAAPAATTTPADSDTIVISLTLHVVNSTAGPNDAFSSRRTKAELQQIGVGINEIWSQANIVFDPIKVSEIEFPPDVLQDIGIGLNTNRFFQQLGQNIVMDQPGTVNGFYVYDAAGVAGFTPQPSQVFFIVDQPPSSPERVSAHEIGHVLGLDHPQSRDGNLMTAGSGSDNITPAQQQIARDRAQRLTVR